MPNFIPKSSAHIKQASYDPATRHLSVTFSTTGRTYTHSKVPPEVYEAFSRFRSAGSYYHRFIKHYPLI